jgi:hypothetical protein
MTLKCEGRQEVALKIIMGSLSTVRSKEQGRKLVSCRRIDLLNGLPMFYAPCLMELGERTLERNKVDMKW